MEQIESTPVKTNKTSKDLRDISAWEGPLPDHTQLPAEDGTFVKNFQEHPQSILLTESIWPLLMKLHPDGHFAIGQDSGIYWRITEPKERGAVSPDWYYVANVPPTLDGQMRRSYVMWQEYIAPLIIIEFVSDDDGREYDRTPYTGKFWIYENVVRPGYYAIYNVQMGIVEVYRFSTNHFEIMKPNERRHFPIPELGVELGIWFGEYKNVKLPWLRWWADSGELIPTPEVRAELEEERANAEADRADAESQRADAEAKRAELLAAKLRELGINPEEIAP